MHFATNTKGLWTLLLNLKLHFFKLFKFFARNASIIVPTLCAIIVLALPLYSLSYYNKVNVHQNKRFYRRHHDNVFQLAAFWRVFQFVFTKFNIKHTTTIQEADIFWYHLKPCSQRLLNQTLADLAGINKELTLFGVVEGCDQIGKKQFVWNVSENVYGRDIAKRMIPETFRLNDATNMKLFEQNYQNGKMYILKNERHNQQGLKLSSDKEYILSEALNDGYVLAQEYMTNPYLLNGRKMNMRIYLVIKCKENNAEGYLYEHGQCYYTNKTFKAESHYSSAHFPQDIIETLPMHTNELRDFMGIDEYKQVNDQIFDISKAVFGASKHLFCGSEQFKDYNRLHLFGADFMFDENLHVYLLEINTNPCLADSTDLRKQSKEKYDHWQETLIENYLKLAQDSRVFGKDKYEFRSLL